MKSRIVGGGGSVSSSVVESGVTAALESFFPDDIVRRTIHNASSANINGSAGAYVAFGDGLIMGVAGKSVVVSSTIGQPLEIVAAATLGDASTSPRRFYINQGEGPTTLPFKPQATDFLWIKSLSTTGATNGYVTLNIGG